MVGMDSRCYVHDHAHIQVLKLCVHQWIDDARRARCSHSHTCLKASRGHRHAAADPQFRVLPIHDADLRIVDNARRAVGQQCRRRRLGIVRL